MTRKTCRMYDLCLYIGPTAEDIETGERMIVVGASGTDLVMERITDGKAFYVPPASAQLIATAVPTSNQVV